MARISSLARCWLLGAACVLGALLPTATAQTASAAESVVLGGGSGIIVVDPAGAPRNYCTLTTIGRDRAGRLVGLTAGHCAAPGDRISAEYRPGGGTVGTVAAVNPAYDYAVIEFDGPVVASSTIGGTRIDAAGPPAVFPNVVCKEGRSTGRTCGLTYGDLFNSQQTFSQTCTDSGDSGAPLVVGTTLVAMVNSYFFVPCLGPSSGTDFRSILREIDRAGGVGAGLVPVP